jgi:putative endonuclease
MRFLLSCMFNGLLPLNMAAPPCAAGISELISDSLKRIWEHKNNSVDGFTRKYDVHFLVWYELHETMESAIQRKKRIKRWKRAWKLELIEEMNPEWRDLYPDLLG